MGIALFVVAGEITVTFHGVFREVCSGKLGIMFLVILSILFVTAARAGGYCQRKVLEILAIVC